MAEPKLSVELSPEQGRTIGQLSTVMKLAAIVLVGVGGLRLVGGVYTLLFVANVGLLHILEGAPMAFLGLVLLAASASTRHIVDTKYGALHTGAVFGDLATFYKILAGVAMFLTFIIALWWIFG